MAVDYIYVPSGEKIAYIETMCDGCGIGYLYGFLQERFRHEFASLDHGEAVAARKRILECWRETPPDERIRL